MKTAISIPDEVFKKIEALAKEQGRSRSEVFTLAAVDFLERVKNKKLLNLLNEVYSAPGFETAEDKQGRRKAANHFAKKVLKEPY